MSASDGSGPLRFALLWVSLRSGLSDLSGGLGEMLPQLLEAMTGRQPA
jgi:hypothetical protein